MSNLVLRRVWATDIQPAGRKLVAVKLADSCDDAGGSLFPSMAYIAASCNLSRAQAQRHVHALIADGYLSVIANAAGGAPGTVPHYKLHVDRLTESKSPARRMDATPAGNLHATGSADATGGADEVEGPHQRAKGVASVRQTGSTHAAQPIHIHQTPIKETQKPLVTKKTLLPAAFDISDEVRLWACKNGYAELEAHLEHFVGYAKAKAATYADWDQAFMNAIRTNWAKLPKAGQHATRPYSKYAAAATGIFGAPYSEVIDV